MPTSHYFNHTNNRAEQHLIEDLFNECIFLFGTDAFYLPRDTNTTDFVYGEDPLKSFTSNYPIEIFNLDVQEFQGQKEMFSKFGIDLKNEYSVIVSRKSFLQRVAQNTQYNRPLEGDLLWIPHVRGKGILYEITFVDPETDMNLLGRQNVYYWTLKLEPFKYSQEVLQTGLPEIDAISGQDAYTISFLLSSANSSGQFVVNEIVYQGANLSSSTAKAYVSYWDNPSLTLNVTNITGIFSNNANVIGSTSNAHYKLLSYDPTKNNLIREILDNENILDEGLTNINLDENNPFGII